jgi:glutaminyl-tRNA synthetase
VVELRCTYDPATRGGSTPDGRQVKGTIHWVTVAESLPCEVRLYDRLFTVPDPESVEGDFKDYVNPGSLVVVRGARVEPSVAADPPGSSYQFERLGYFCSDRVDSAPGTLVYNRTVTLRDAWAKAAAPSQPAAEIRQKPEHRAPQTPQVAEIPERARELEAARLRYISELGLAPAEADVLTRGGGFVALFEATAGLGVPARAVAGMIVNDLIPELRENGIVEIAFMPEDLRALIALVEDGTISRSNARVALGAMARGEGRPAELVERLGLRQMSDDSALVPLVEQVLAENPGKVEEYRSGRTGLLGFFTGQVKRLSGGSANAERVQALLKDRL